MPPRSEPLGVYVIGMHRSGTSATTRLVNLLGVPIGEHGLTPGNDANPPGFWEITPLTDLNDALLAELGGTWWWPPPLESLISADRLLRDRLEGAAKLFRHLHPGPQWVWKDPRTCLTLGFWRKALAQRSVIVFASRDPVEAATSLTSGQGPSPRVVSMWEHYVHAALLLSRGVPSLVVDFAHSVSDPGRTAERIAGFLEDHGAQLADGGRERAAASIQPELHRRHRDARAHGLLSPEQARLAAMLRHAAAEGQGLDAIEPPATTEQTRRWLHGTMG